MVEYDYDDISWSSKEKTREQAAITKHNKKLKRELAKAEQRKRDLELSEIRASYRADVKEKKKISTTKLIILFIFLNCTVVEAYSMWVMYKLVDLSALYALIGAVITESISFAVYCVKAFSETKEEEKLRFERERFNAENNRCLDRDSTFDMPNEEVTNDENNEEEIGNDVL